MMMNAKKVDYFLIFMCKETVPTCYDTANDIFVFAGIDVCIIPTGQYYHFTGKIIKTVFKAASLVFVVIIVVLIYLDVILFTEEIHWR